MYSLFPTDSVISPPSTSNLSSNRGTFGRTKCDLDLDLLDCPICMKQYKSRVYQCGNGHLVCLACWTKLRVQGSRCPSCSGPIGIIRNLAVENILQSLQVSCKHVAHGCNKMLRFKLRKSHQKNCEFKPLKCPVECCSYCGPKQNFLDHFKSDKHRFPSVHIMESKHGLFQSVCTESGKPTFTVSQAQTHVIITVAHSCELYLLHHVKLPCPTKGDIFFITSFGKRRQLYSMEVYTEDKIKDEEEYKDEDEDEDDGDEDDDVDDEDEGEGEGEDKKWPKIWRWESDLEVSETTTRYSIVTCTVDINQPRGWKKHQLFVPEQSSDDLPNTFNIALNFINPLNYKTAEKTYSY